MKKPKLILPSAVASAKTFKRLLKLRDYQKPALKYAMEHDICVLSVAPNGGKTEISIAAIIQYLILFPDAKILVLAHSTTVLKDNYFNRLEEMELPFTYSKTFDPTKQVHICLPQSQHLITGKYDFLIVDEAHQNYLAGSEEKDGNVKRIIKKIEPKKQLLLTGSPEKFIKKGSFDIYVLAVNEMPVKYFAQLQVELVASDYSWKGQYNADLELRKEYKFSKEETENTLENVMITLLARLKSGLSAEEFNRISTITKLREWAHAFRKIGKTIIMCASVKQADFTFDILKDHEVNVAVSHNESDMTSEEIENFKNGKYDALIVVDRARLGYSDIDLFNIVDMSGTHNPSMIYQIFCRVLRGDPSMQKYYVKVTSKEYGQMDYTHICVSAALMLTDAKFLSTFNGSNFNGILIPTFKKRRVYIGDAEISGGKGLGQPKFFLPEFSNNVIDMFKNIIHNLDNPATIYKLTSIREVRISMGDLEKRTWTEEEIFASARGEA